MAAVERNAAEHVRRTNADRAPVEAVLGDAFDLTAADDRRWRDMLADVDVLLAGDVFYSQPLADRAMPFLRRIQRSGIRVLVGDAGRGFLPTDRFDLLTQYDVPTRAAVDDAETMRATVCELRPSPAT